MEMKTPVEPCYKPEPGTSMCRLFSIRGLSAGLPTSNSALIPTDLVQDMASEAKQIVDNPIEHMRQLGEKEQKEILRVFAIVSKHFKIPHIEVAKSHLTLNLQRSEERQEIDASTFEEILTEDPVSLPHNVIPYASLRIEKSDACRWMSTESKAPDTLFLSNKSPKNNHGFPYSDFSKRLKLTRRIILDAGVQGSLMAAACAAVSAFNRVLNNDHIQLNTGLVICPLEQFRTSIINTGKTLTQLVDYHTDYRGARRRSVKARLEMEVKMRCLVAVHYLDLALLMAKPAAVLGFEDWKRIKDDLKDAIKGLYFMSYITKTFPHTE